MIANIVIKLIPDDQIHSILPMVRRLNPTLTDSILQERLTQMVLQGYQCAGLYVNDDLVGICGLWMITKFYVGKHIEPDNVFILPEYRRSGYGRRLLKWVYEYGKTQGCVASEMNCYIANTTGNIFWEREGFAKIGYHYQRLIE